MAEIEIVKYKKTRCYKFIVALVIMRDSSTRVVFRGENEQCDFHSEILRRVWFEPEVVSAECIGGGQYDVNETGVIRLWSNSGAYGYPPRWTTSWLRSLGYSVIAEEEYWTTDFDLLDPTTKTTDAG